MSSALAFSSGVISVSGLGNPFVVRVAGLGAPDADACPSSVSPSTFVSLSSWVLPSFWKPRSHQQGWRVATSISTNRDIFLQFTGISKFVYNFDYDSDKVALIGGKNSQYIQAPCNQIFGQRLLSNHITCAENVF